MKRVSFKTLGCKLNQAETESVAAGFRALGWQVVEFATKADVTVVNTCTVTNTADRKSRSAMNRALGFAHRPLEANEDDEIGDPPLVVMTGCYVDGHRQALEADGRTYVVPGSQKSRIPSLVDAHFRGEVLPGQLEDGGDPFGYPLAERVFRTRAMVKVQDGCDNFCTFCIIPYVRGAGVSRSLDDVVRSVEEAAVLGYKEVVLTGVNMSRWESGSGNFADLVEAALEASGDFRLRLGSIEPDRIDERFLDLMAHPRMTPHLHLCLQSGSEKILSAMRRQYTAASFEEIALNLRRRNSLFNITTDVIVGFPGESDKDFEDTLSLCERIGFGHIHTFPYSRREGTPADEMPGHVNSKVKKERAGAIRVLSEGAKGIYRKSLVGTFQNVIVERGVLENDGGLTARGLSAPYVPVRFSLPGIRRPEDVQNRLFRVRIDAVDKSNDLDLLGTVDGPIRAS